MQGKTHRLHYVNFYILFLVSSGKLGLYITFNSSEHGCGYIYLLGWYVCCVHCRLGPRRSRARLWWNNGPHSSKAKANPNILSTFLPTMQIKFDHVHFCNFFHSIINFQWMLLLWSLLVMPPHPTVAGPEVDLVEMVCEVPVQSEVGCAGTVEPHCNKW